MRCDHCPAPEGAECDPSRTPRRCELARDVPAYRWRIAGEADGPREASPASLPSPPGFDRTYMDAAADRLRADREWLIALPDEIKQAASDCPLRVIEKGRLCCGGDAPVCRSGPRDGQVVDSVACCRCKAGGSR